MFPRGVSGCVTGNNLTTAAVPSAYHSRRFSSKASSDNPSGAAPESEAESESGAAESATSTPPNALVSSEGASPSLLTGPRVTSRKGYLERENMIRETQKAVREYYKEGMYQVRGQLDSPCKCMVLLRKRHVSFSSDEQISVRIGSWVCNSNDLRPLVVVVVCTSKCGAWFGFSRKCARKGYLRGYLAEETCHILCVPTPKRKRTHQSHGFFTREIRAQQTGGLFTRLRVALPETFLCIHRVSSPPL